MTIRWWEQRARSFDPPPPGVDLKLAGSDLTPGVARLLSGAFVIERQVAGSAEPTLQVASWPSMIDVGTGLKANEPHDEVELWRAHARALADWRAGEAAPVRPGELSVLKVKAELAVRLTIRCRCCIHYCRVRRDEGGLRSGRYSRCGTGSIAETRVGDVQIVLGEEAFLSPTVAVWFAGCPEHCVGCLYAPLISARHGQPFQPEELAEQLRALAAEGRAQSLMMLGGSPDVHLAACLLLLRAGAPALPLVWNSNAQTSTAALRVLDGLVGVYLLDLKFRSRACAAENHASGLYLARIARTVHGAARQGALVVLRVLVRPGHTTCCAIPLITYAARLARRYPNVRVHPMLGWLPVYDAARHPVQGWTLSREEQAAAEQMFDTDPVLSARRVR
ncbi:MAG: 4Fe-4S cluster-binding domain-containing protein [Chloroflexi bacterium]|nr:4Fe-4S cluster-binding domain-containing protein [Chloroflexota bacterium]